MAHPEDALTITRRALELGFETTVGIIHDHDGQLDPLKENERAVYDQILKERKPAMFAFAYDNLFHKNLALGQPNDWQCRAGSRYLYICEQGLVHYCSQQRGYPAIPLDKYTQIDLDREYSTKKPCAPFCTVSCVHRVAMLDLVRNQPREALTRFFPPATPGRPGGATGRNQGADRGLSAARRRSAAKPGAKDGRRRRDENLRRQVKAGSIKDRVGVGRVPQVRQGVPGPKKTGEAPPKVFTVSTSRSHYDCP